MSTTTDSTPNGTGTTQKQPKANAKKEFKILMLHGYTQSGPLFRSKTRALEKLLAKALTPLNLTLNCIYPTAPLKLNPADIPGYQPPADDAEETPDPDAWAWFRRRDAPSDASSPSYIGLDEGMFAVAAALRSAGGADAVLGFSQGGAMAALVAAVLETPHREAPAEQAPWAAALREANAGRGLRFAAVYSGFFAVDESLAWCFAPKVRTPTIQFIGSLDTVVDEGRSRALVDRCEDASVVVHPGGHYVPISKEWAMALAGYVQHHAQDLEAAKM